MEDPTRAKTPGASTVWKGTRSRMLDSPNGVIEREKDIEGEGIECLGSSSHPIITINMNGKSHGEGTADERRHLIVSILKRSSASVIFCQEVPDKFETEVVKKCYGDYEYAVTGKESAVMWRLKDFDGDPVQGTSITKILERLQKEKSDVDVSEVRTRTAMVKLRNRETGAFFLAVSWHGPHKVSDNAKLRAFYGLICFLDEVCETLCSFIIGGDFNFDTRLISEAVPRKYGITISISSYELCTRDQERLLTTGSGRDFVPYKDNFIASVTIPSDITVYWVEPSDLENESSENALLDHVPVVATLTLVRTYKTKSFIKQDRGKLEQHFQSHTFQFHFIFPFLLTRFSVQKTSTVSIYGKDVLEAAALTAQNTLVVIQICQLFLVNNLVHCFSSQQIFVWT